MFLRYDETGRINEAVHLHDAVFGEWARNHPTFTYLEIDEDLVPSTFFETCYIKDGELQVRPSIDAPAAVAFTVGDSFTISDLPIPCNVTVADEIFEVEDGEIVLEGEMSDVYDVIVEAWPHLSATIHITVE